MLLVSLVFATICQLALSSQTLDSWLVQQQQRHVHVVGNSPAHVVGNSSLPPGCVFTVPNHTQAVACVVNDASPKYDPVAVAAAISKVSSIMHLSFAVDTAAVGQLGLTDKTLRLVAQNLNSSSVQDLHVFLGALANVSDLGIASFVGLNPTALDTITTLGFAIERNQLTDSSLTMMGQIAASQYENIRDLDLDLANQFGNLTLNGVLLLVNGVVRWVGDDGLPLIVAIHVEAQDVDLPSRDR